VSGQARASIVVIGDEILDGFVRDSNAGWLAGRLHALGIPLDRISVVPDEEVAIAEALAEELARDRPRVVFTSGGIGTTPDDRTMASVAAFLQVDLVTDPALDAMVERIVTRLEHQGRAVDDVQRAALGKLARVPQGARPILNTGPPSALIDLDRGPAGGGVGIVVLPGVPEQFRSLVGHLESSLLAALGAPCHTGQLTHPYPESLLTPVLEELERRRPDVRIGSYPGPECVLRVHGPRAAVEEVVAELRSAIAALDDDPTTKGLAEQWRDGWRELDDGADLGG
jgi:molybdopterin-biosynthesis enzyme MoeA-like protein